MFEFIKNIYNDITGEDPLDKMNRMREELGEVIDSALEKYNDEHCACCYPRFLQMVSIDSCDYPDADFECFETETFIRKARRYFDTERVEDPKESFKEKWVCKKCGSEYESLWHNFSESVHHHVLKPVDIVAEPAGKDTLDQIPLYIGLAGIAFPPKGKVETVELDEFRDYVLER